MSCLVYKSNNFTYFYANGNVWKKYFFKNGSLSETSEKNSIQIQTQFSR